MRKRVPRRKNCPSESIGNKSRRVHGCLSSSPFCPPPPSRLAAISLVRRLKQMALAVCTQASGAMHMRRWKIELGRELAVASLLTPFLSRRAGFSRFNFFFLSLSPPLEKRAIFAAKCTLVVEGRFGGLGGSAKIWVGIIWKGKFQGG